MWNLMAKKSDECNHLQDLLEDAAAMHPRAASVEELIAALSPVQRTHFVECRSCREVVEDRVKTWEIFKGVASYREEAAPWFARRVMTAIATREKQVSELAKTWLAVPKFASRLALASGALLLVASTWIYERPFAAPAAQATSAASQESLFEAPPTTANQDDVFISRAERNQ
jgi:hypothetical protein